MPGAVAHSLPAERNALLGPWRSCRARSVDEIDDWEESWRQLDASVPCPFAHFNWTRAFVRAFSADVQPWLVGVMRRGTCVALAPLVRERIGGVRRLLLGGVAELGEPMDLVWSDAKGLDRLLVALARGGAPLVFDRMFADSPSVRALKRIYRARAIVISRPRLGSPYLELDENALEPENHLSAPRRAELRQARHDAERLGPITTEIHVPDLDELSDLLDTAFDVEAAGPRHRMGSAIMLDAYRAAFYRHYAEATATEGSLRVCLLRIGDRVAAMQLAVEVQNGFWLLAAGHDSRFAQCSPERLLERETIRYAAEAGLAGYEFLGQAAEGASFWTEEVHPCVAVRVYPLGLRGLSALISDGCAAIARRWRGSAAAVPVERSRASGAGV